MYTKFYDNTVVTRFIKQLVATTEVPTISVWHPGEFAIRGVMYISANSIWRCNHTGFPTSLTDSCTIQEHQLLTDKLSDASLDVPYFTRISEYVPGEHYDNITSTYKSNTLGYDPQTHFQLGQYLRMVRDIYNLDMMPFYNCFNGVYLYGVDFTSSASIHDTQSTFFKIYSVPVHFGKTYTVAFDSSVPVEMMTAFVGPKGVLTQPTKILNGVESEDFSSTYQSFQTTSFKRPVVYQTKSWHQIDNVFTYDENGRITYAPEQELSDIHIGQFEKYLRLLIKVPRTVESSLVVLEGDYSLDPSTMSNNTQNVTFLNQDFVDATVNSQTVSGKWLSPQKVVSYENPDLKTYHIQYSISGERHSYYCIATTVDEAKGQFTEFLNQQSSSYLIPQNIVVGDIVQNAVIDIVPTHDYVPMLSPLGLLQMSDKHNYAFSDRLVEYLVQHVINHLDVNTKDTERIQKYVSSDINAQLNHSRYQLSYTPGVWDMSLRRYIFQLLSETNTLTRKIDLTGYVDKDAEKVITRGQGV